MINRDKGLLQDKLKMNTKKKIRVILKVKIKKQKAN